MVYIGVFLALFIGKHLFLFLMPRFGWWFSWWLVLLLQKWCAIKGVFGPVHWQKFVLIFLIWMVERSGDSLIPRKLYDVSLLLPERFHRRTSWLGVKRVTSALQRVQSRGGLWLGLAGWALSLMGSEHWRCYYWWPQCAYCFYATKIMIIFQKKPLVKIPPHPSWSSVINALLGVYEKYYSITYISTASSLKLRRILVLDQNYKPRLIWAPLLWKIAVCWGWRNPIHWSPGLSNHWWGWRNHTITVKQHLHTWWTCYNNQRAPHYHLKCSYPLSVSVSIWCVEGKWKPLIRVQICYSLVRSIEEGYESPTAPPIRPSNRPWSSGGYQYDWAK